MEQPGGAPPSRTERDLLGERTIPGDALWGIYTDRAAGNFPIAGRPVHPRLIHAYGDVKLAAARTNRALGESRLNEPEADAIERACSELAAGGLDHAIRVDALQGGAGTSTNMAVNEVIANRARQILGRPLGTGPISPLDDVNRHQSTNDTYPTALKVAAIRGVRELEQAVVELQQAFQAKEQEFADVVKVGRTQLQDAVLITLGREMSAYADAFGRDRWRIYKCEERLRVVNLGGTAVGTGLGAPRQYIFRVTETLREITGIGLARGENLVDATQNVDVFVEVSGILRALATTLFKCAGDLRLLASGPDAGFGEIRLPAVQAGSSIMPGKVNPVIPEAVQQAALAVQGHDQVIANACALGNLELNQFLPLIADALLTEIDLLIAASRVFRERCIEGLEADRERCRAHVDSATAVVTALVPILGYDRAQQLATDARTRGQTIRDAVIAEGLLTADEFDAAITPAAVQRLGSPPTRRKPT
jgi:aspartate ammonia-lyase